MSNYIHTPKTISYNDIVECDFSLSSSRHKKFEIANQNCKLVKEFLTRALSRKDLGVEVGSANYIGQSSHYFLRTKALQDHSYLPEITPETALPIMPSSFVKMNLKAGDLIISKDSNIGEIVILDKDYPNMMLSGALYKLPVSQYKYYLLAMMKHAIFREQLDFIVPKGATIRHAKTLFLDCKIPMPNENADNVIQFVENLTQAIVNKQRLIKERHQAILALIEKELLDNQKDNTFSFNLPTIKEIENVGRLDTGIYSRQFKEITFKIQNYRHGMFFIEKDKIHGGSTPDIRYIGNSKDLKYRWVTPTICSDFGVLSEERLNLAGKNNINSDCIVLVNRTSKGGIGEYVGIAGFYKFQDFGEGHHNQGMYRVTDYDETQLLFMLAFLNCSIMRKFCADLSVGSKMKELKIEQILQIPFPNFPTEKQQEISKLYHNPIIYDVKNATLDNFLALDDEFNSQAGIYELDNTAKQLQAILNQAIESIIENKPVDMKFNL
ncbi:hypothetical protein [Avibacterium avium]|uniref:hypothetical protein n=1 Tax=Avibacterium avium TaxID=751 RepID=UPI003BF922A4